MCTTSGLGRQGQGRPAVGARGAHSAAGSSGQELAAGGREPVLLVAAGGLVGDGHHQPSGVEQGLHDLVPELGAVAPAGVRHDLAYRLSGKAVTQNLDLVPTWCLRGPPSVCERGLVVPVPGSPPARGASGRRKVVVTQFSETSIIGSATPWSMHAYASAHGEAPPSLRRQIAAQIEARTRRLVKADQPSSL